MGAKKKSVKAVARRVTSQDTKLRKSGTKDSFQNFAAKMGMGTDNLMAQSSYGFNPISRMRQILEWIHRGSWIGGVAIDLVADDMTRAGIELKGELTPEQIDQIEAEATRLNLWGCIADSLKWSRLYGGCIALNMVDGQNPIFPLRLETVGKRQYQGLLVMDRWMVEPSLNDLVTEQGPNIGLPRFYTITADAPALPHVRIHHSRVMRLEGVRLPYWQRLQENLWGISEIERLYDRMVAFDSATTGAAQLVYKSYIRTYKIKDLREAIAEGADGIAGLMKMVDVMRRFQSIEGITLLDAEDEFEATTSNPGAGISEVLQELKEQLAGALQIPLTRLFGQNPKGLGNEGGNDLRTYYDGIAQKQERTLLTPVTRMYRMIAQSLGIPLPKDFSIKFRTLWQLDDKQKAEIAKTVTDTVLSGAEAGVKPSAMLKELKQSSEITGIWTNISDEDITEADLMPPPGMEGMGEVDPLTGEPTAPAAPQIPPAPKAAPEGVPTV